MIREGKALLYGLAQHKMHSWQNAAVITRQRHPVISEGVGLASFANINFQVCIEQFNHRYRQVEELKTRLENHKAVLQRSGLSHQAQESQRMLDGLEIAREWSENHPTDTDAEEQLAYYNNGHGLKKDVDRAQLEGAYYDRMSRYVNTQYESMHL